MKSISPERLIIALKSGQNAQCFTFSRSWTAPRTVLHLDSGQLALVKIAFLFADEYPACEDLLIGLPVLQHFENRHEDPPRE